MVPFFGLACKYVQKHFASYAKIKITRVKRKKIVCHKN